MSDDCRGLFFFILGKFGICECPSWVRVKFGSSEKLSNCVRTVTVLFRR